MYENHCHFSVFYWCGALCQCLPAKYEVTWLPFAKIPTTRIPISAWKPFLLMSCLLMSCLLMSCLLMFATEDMFTHVCYSSSRECLCPLHSTLRYFLKNSATVEPDWTYFPLPTKHIFACVRNKGLHKDPVMSATKGNHPANWWTKPCYCRLCQLSCF